MGERTIVPRIKRTRDLRIDEYPSEGNALPIYNAERERRVKRHQERIQRQLRRIGEEE